MLRVMNTIKARTYCTNAKNNHLCANEVQVIGTQNGKFNRDSHANSRSDTIEPIVIPQNPNVYSLKH